jgi:hypothetical protein
MFDENTIIILIVLLLLFYFFCKKDVVEGIDPEEKPPSEEKSSEGEKPPSEEKSTEGDKPVEGDKQPSEEKSTEGDKPVEGDKPSEEKPPVEGENPPVEGEESKEEKPSVEGEKIPKDKGRIKSYGRRKQEVKGSETSQELRNFVNTNFEGLVKNEFKFCETKGHKNGELCSKDSDIKSGLRKWAKGKNISTDTTPPKTMIVQIQSFLDQQKKAEEMKKAEEIKKAQEVVKKQEFIPPEKMITEPPVPPTYLSSDERKITQLKNLQDKIRRKNEQIRNRHMKEMEEIEEIRRKASIVDNKAHANLTNQPVMAKCQLGVGEEYKYNPHRWYRKCEGGEDANIENCNKDSLLCDLSSKDQNTDDFKSKCKQIHGNPQPVLRKSCEYKKVGDSKREDCNSGSNYVRLDSLQDENDPNNNVAQGLGMNRSKLQRSDKGSCGNLVKESLESDNPKCVGNGGNSWACKFPDTSKNAIMLQWTGPQNRGNQMIYSSNSMDQSQSNDWLNNHKGKIIYMIVNQGGKKLAMMNQSYNLEFEENMDLIKNEINNSSKWEQGLRLVPVEKTLFDVQMKRIFGKKNSEGEYVSAYIKNSGAKTLEEKYGTRSFGKQGEIHNNDEAKESAHDIWNSHFPTQSSLQTNNVESSCMCRQE